MTQPGLQGCCGCRSCEQKCPKGAITMAPDREGFLKPRVDGRKCIDCGLCRKVCPLENPVFYPKAESARLFYHNDSSWRMSASSAGAFEAVCRAWVKDRDFSAFGCTLEGLHARHMEAQDWDALQLLKKSKYVQSDTGNTFTAVKQRLTEGRRVVFVGTPCQVMGLSNFLGKPHENLLTVDFVCHGTPSPKALEMYVKSLEKQWDKRIKNIQFRPKYFDPKRGWLSLGMMVYFEDGTQCHIPDGECEYMLCFLKGAMSGYSCFHCPFATTARCSDVTLGDLWGVEKRYPELGQTQTDGVSMLLLNSPKAGTLEQALAAENARYETVDIGFVTAANKQLTAPSTQHSRRSLFYRDMRLVGFDGAVKWLYYGPPLTRLKRRLLRK